MALNGNTWGTSVAAAVKAAVTSAGIQAGTPITDSQLETIWKAVKTADTSHITGNAVTSTPGAAAGASTLSGTVS